MIEISDLYEDGVSNCCGALVLTPDVCTDCKEHCGIEDGDA